MATIAQGGTIQIQSSSYGGVGHPHTHLVSPQGQTPPRNFHQTIPPPHHRFLHFDLNRIIDNNFDQFYLTIT